MSSEASSGIIQMVKMANDYYPDMSVRHVFLYAPALMSEGPASPPARTCPSAKRAPPRARAHE